MKPQTFDKLWIDSWRAELGGDRPVTAAKLITKLADLRPGSTLVDFGCGTGLVAHALTQLGVSVTGLERSADALSEARRAANGLCKFVSTDWRDYQPDTPFDCAIFWFTTLCGGDEHDLHALRIAHRAIRADGTLLIETRHWDRVPRRYDRRSERGSESCTLVEQHSYDSESKIQTTNERYFIGGSTVSRIYQTRRYALAELRDMCVQAGFDCVDTFDEAGLPLSEGSERLVVRARSRTHVS